jgi:hypothetical protein
VVNRLVERRLVDRFLQPEVGHAYGIDRSTKLSLVDAFHRNVQQIPSATAYHYHLLMAREILSIPPGKPGDVVECGCWKGGSTANLSLVCALVSRQLVVCDSFQGLPPDEKEAQHQYPHLKVFGFYQAGMYAGRLDEVQANIRRCGNIEACRFVPGFYAQTLKTLDRPVAFAFLDVDLESSIKDCIRHLWPLLMEGGAIYTDDSCDMEIARIWFDDAWWHKELGQRAPGYVGSGCGLPILGDFSSLGYTRKITNPEKVYERVPWLVYPETVQSA